MKQHKTERYCADRQALAAMKRDGLGWGHDLDCGCFYADVKALPSDRFARFFKSFKRT